ncbi:MAG: hypothetical protein A4E31_00292 [Methanomassiliicoccales archaeon PtaU1.Bin030]|nr:MAG: hypothetical protein A4E31_00292 [Methanomassiliicoccales archaeon PtaU1.Bin030]
MNHGNRYQKEMIDKFFLAMRQAVRVHDVDKGAVCITTPFLDWQGCPTKIFVTKEGVITDGGGTVNLLKALRSYDQFEGWPLLSDFLVSYCISFDGKSMMLDEKESEDCLIRYAQGISRLPSYFEPKPICSTEDRFPEKVKGVASEFIEMKYPLASKEETERRISSIIRSRSIPLKGGISVTSDLSPVSQEKMVMIISHAQASPSVQKQHIQSKLFDPIVWKREHGKGKAYAVIESTEYYQQTAIRLLENETEEIIQLKDTYGKERLTDILVTA